QSNPPSRQPEEVVAGGLRQQPVGVAHASDRSPTQPPAEATYAEQVKAMQEIEFQKQRQDGLRAQTAATERFQAGDIDRALEILQSYKNKLDDCALDSEKVALLRRPIDARLQQFKMLQAQQQLHSQVTQRKKTFEELQNHEYLVEKKKQEDVA